MKAAWFHNEVADYIEQEGYFAGDIPECASPAGGFTPYFDGIRDETIAKARLRGFDFEGIYETCRAFVGLRGHIIRGDNLEDGVPRRTVPADQVTVLLGFRLPDEKLTLGGETRFVAGQDRLPPARTRPGRTRWSISSPATSPRRASGSMHDWRTSSTLPTATI